MMRAPKYASNFPDKTLASLRKGEQAVIDGMISAPEEAQKLIISRLQEMGFVPGEEVTVIAEAIPSGDPMAIRLGSTIFALRRAEAAMVTISRN